MQKFKFSIGLRAIWYDEFIAENCQIKFNWKLVKNYRLAFAFWAPVEDGDDGGSSPGEGVEAIFFNWIGIQF